MAVPAGVMTLMPQSTAKHEQIDLATTQAVLELRTALRTLDALQHEDLEGRADVYLERHADDLSAARIRHLGARASLELVLLGDE